MTSRRRDDKYHALILAGGLGVRLWPKSRASRPKQFQTFGDQDKTLLQQTISRLSPIFSCDSIWVITKPQHVGKVMDQVNGLKKDHVFVEPEPKGTAAAIAWASARIENLFPDSVIGVFPTDHLIENEDGFRDHVAAGLEWAAVHPQLVVFGVRPTRPETAYGYIESDGTAGASRGMECLKVRCFHEKPDEATAREYILKGNTFWNSGIFIFRTETLLRSLSLYAPTVWGPLKEIMKTVEAKNHISRRSKKTGSMGHGHGNEIKRLYSLMPDESIDKCLIEKLVPPCRLPPIQNPEEALPPERCAASTDNHKGAFCLCMKMGIHHERMEVQAQNSPASTYGELGLVVIPSEFGWSDVGIWETFYALLEKDLAKNALSGLTAPIECSDCLIVSGKGMFTAALGVKGLAIIADGDCVLVCPRDRLDEISRVLDEIKKRGLSRYL
ncbi:MAG: mannose-1-phosphate guanylyltransferase [Desulfobacteraceae bacterium]|nr:mannose-1-phosphate guanylyltransferase [Desulfobacteraceae bacterium]